MSSVKDTMSEIIAQQPDDSTYDEILRELAYARMVRRGLEDSDAGRTVSDDTSSEALKEMLLIGKGGKEVGDGEGRPRPQ